MITNDTMLVQLTVGQLRDIIDDRVQQALQISTPDEDPLGTLVHGLDALAKFLGYSVPYTSVLVKSGKYKEAIVRGKGSRRISFYPKVLKKLLQEESLQTL